MEVFLKARSWQLFLLIVVPLFLPSPDGVGFFGFLGITWIVSLLVLIAWLYSIGMAANARLQNELKAKTILYHVALVIPILYSFIFLFLFWQAELIQPPVWLLFLQFVSTGCMVYGLWFTARQFVNYTEGGQGQLAGYMKTVLLFLFFPLGVWLLQPRVNAAF